MKVAVVGAGLAGLSVCWHLGQKKGTQTTLFDPKGIGGGASGISTGLLHPFPGKKALRSHESSEGMAATETLIAISSEAMQRPVAEKSGVFRPAITEQQMRDFSLRGEKDPEAEWQETSPFGPGLWIPKGMALYSQLYLKGLWKACEKQGSILVQESIASLEDLASFDAMILCAGFEILRFFPTLPLQATKGQTLLCRWPQRLPWSLVSQGHITPTEDDSICHIGSTYERSYSSLEPTTFAIAQLKEKAVAFYPPAKDFEVLEVRAGVRISRPLGYRPIAQKMGERVWVFTGLGSRGLLYHALLGKRIADEVAIS